MIRKLIALLLLVASIKGFGQVVLNKKITTTTNKTTFLIFPNNVKFFDKGAASIGVENSTDPKILRLKAVKPGFTETNLTVLCEGDLFYSFIINYSVNPDTLNYILRTPIGHEIKKINTDTLAQSNAVISTERSFKSDINSAIFASKAQSVIVGVKNEGIIMALKGVYIKENNLYFAIEMVNTTKINYDINFVKFLVKDKKRLRQSSLQELEQVPVYSAPEVSILKDSNPITVIYVFNKFTIPGNKKLIIDMWDKSGERNVSLEVSSSTIFKAKQLQHL